MVVPKEPAANLEYRAKILELAENDPDLQEDLYTACSQSVLYFVNAFAFTLRIFEQDETGKRIQAKHAHLPYVTWKIQDDHIRRIEAAIENGEELLTDKSRDMGATWNHIIVYVHRFLFRDHESHLMISRKEDAVDGLSGLPKNYPFGNVADPGTLFGKIDYVLSRLPEWMLPKMNRKGMHLTNLDTGTRIDGESSNATAGSSDRRTSILLDEMAKMLEGESIKRSTRDVTACRLANSTPDGAGTAYSQWRMSGTIPVFVLAWWDHPEKGKGRYLSMDDLGRWKIRSPWYDNEAQKRSPKELAIEVDMDHVGSGDIFFEAMVLEQHKKLYAKESPKRLGINFRKGVPDDKVANHLTRWDITKIIFTPNGPWRIWTELREGRPDQTRNYVLGIDISKGQGASNSVISITCIETREKIAEFADANTSPSDFARIACAAALWTGGRNKPLMIWENNGDPGFDFGNKIMHTYSYPHVYFARMVGTVAQKRGKRYGWRSTPEAKAVALGLLRRAYAHGGFINHSLEALNEAATYIQFEGGGIGPAQLVAESDANRKSHGDRVIADMLCVVGMGESPYRKVTQKVNSRNTFKARKDEWMGRERAKKDPRNFDWSQPL